MLASAQVYVLTSTSCPPPLPFSKPKPVSRGRVRFSAAHPGSPLKTSTLGSTAIGVIREEEIMSTTTTTTTTTSATTATTTTTTPTGTPRPSLSAPTPSYSTRTPSSSMSSSRDSRDREREREAPNTNTSSKRTPVPLILESFPVPPTHIPPSPALPLTPLTPGGLAPSTTNPPPSGPPTLPLPPVPGPSRISEHEQYLLMSNINRLSSSASINGGNRLSRSSKASGRESVVSVGSHSGHRDRDSMLSTSTHGGYAYPGGRSPTAPASPLPMRSPSSLGHGRPAINVSSAGVSPSGSTSPTSPTSSRHGHGHGQQPPPSPLSSLPPPTATASLNGRHTPADLLRMAVSPIPQLSDVEFDDDANDDSGHRRGIPKRMPSPTLGGSVWRSAMGTEPLPATPVRGANGKGARERGRNESLSEIDVRQVLGLDVDRESEDDFGGDYGDDYRDSRYSESRYSESVRESVYGGGGVDRRMSVSTYGHGRRVSGGGKEGDVGDMEAFGRRVSRAGSLSQSHSGGVSRNGSISGSMSTSRRDGVGRTGVPPSSFGHGHGHQVSLADPIDPGFDARHLGAGVGGARHPLPATTTSTTTRQPPMPSLGSFSYPTSSKYSPLHAAPTATPTGTQLTTSTSTTSNTSTSGSGSGSTTSNSSTLDANESFTSEELAPGSPLVLPPSPNTAAGSSPLPPSSPLPGTPNLNSSLPGSPTVKDIRLDLRAERTKNRSLKTELAGRSRSRSRAATEVASRKPGPMPSFELPGVPGGMGGAVGAANAAAAAAGSSSPLPPLPMALPPTNLEAIKLDDMVQDMSEQFSEVKELGDVGLGGIVVTRVTTTVREAMVYDFDPSSFVPPSPRPPVVEEDKGIMTLEELGPVKPPPDEQVKAPRSVRSVSNASASASNTTPTPTPTASGLVTPRKASSASLSKPSAKFASKSKSIKSSRSDKENANANASDDERAPSPDITTILSTTPRPALSKSRTKSGSFGATSRSRSRTRASGGGVKRRVSEGSAMSSQTWHGADPSELAYLTRKGTMKSSKSTKSGKSSRGHGDEYEEEYDEEMERVLEGQGSEDEDDFGLGARGGKDRRARGRSDGTTSTRTSLGSGYGSVRGRSGRLMDDEVGEFGELGDSVRGEEQEEDGDSDSSLDLHTPLPHLMVRDGLLSPNSRLLPGAASRAATPMDGRPGSILSVVSSTSMMTKSGLMKDERDTVNRRTRHRDGKLLKAGMGLTTGLGWSDSEDEDAPSPLTRRLSALNLSHRSSASSLSKTNSKSQSNMKTPRRHPLSRSYSSGALLESEYEHEHSHEFDEEDEDYGEETRSSAQRHSSSSAGRYSRSSLPPTSWQSKSARSSTSGRTSTSSASSLVEREGERSKTPSKLSRLSAGARSSTGSTLDRRVVTRGASGDDFRTTSSSTTSASTISIPMPATPKDFDSNSTTPVALSKKAAASMYDKEKNLPPLPAGGLRKAGSTGSSALPSPSTVTPLNGARYAFPKARTFSGASASSAMSVSASAPTSPVPTHSGVRPLRLAQSQSQRLSAGASTTRSNTDRPAVPVPAAVLSASLSSSSLRTPSSIKSPTSTLSPTTPSTPGFSPGTGAESTRTTPSPGVPSTVNNATSTGSGIARPKPRTGTGMVYRTSSGGGPGAASKMKAPSGYGSVGRAAGVKT